MNIFCMVLIYSVLCKILNCGDICGLRILVSK